MITTWSTGVADEHMSQDILVEVYHKVCRHPWWIARARLAVRILAQNGIHPPSSVIDVGCGWGTNLAALEKAGYQTTGLDISRRILEMIDQPGRCLIEADLNRKFPPAARGFDAALMLDVLEHLDDDRSALRRVRSLLRPGGLAIVSVPALPELFSEFDAIQGHRRRYLPETLRAAFEDTGLRLSKMLWWGAWMIPLMRWTRLRRSSRAGSVSQTYADYLRLPPMPGPTLMRLAYRWEESRAVEGKLKSGTSLMAVAVRE
jgi:2-polyprenyl-3-methyl-5-hydroxy-6-metoxy-1,4-benzoquinol methylase